MEKLTWILFSFTLSLYACDGYKILAIFPIASKSHSILGESMVKHLLDAGHEVSYVTPYIKNETHPKLHIVDVSDNLKVFSDDLMDIKLIMDGIISFNDPDFMFEMMHNITEGTLENPNIQTMMRTQKFDVVIGEYMFSDLYSSFGAVFQCPFIWFSTIEPHWMILRLVDGPLNPAYSSDYTHGIVAPYSFSNRIRELWTVFYGLVQYNRMYYNMQDSAYQRWIAPAIQEQGRPVPLFEDLRYNASLVLGNSQVVIGDAVTLPQNYKHIGGYHIDDVVKPLPENLKKLMEGNKNGVIYFSMGSNIKSKDLPNDLKRGLLDVFGRLKQTVIWKFEDVLPDLPKNVHIVHWAPQHSILGHPNLVLFITHGGLLSVTESVYFGVPIISIPVFADQFQNANRAEAKGYGKKITLSYTMHKDLKPVVEEILGNPKYAAVAKELSKAIRDRQHKPKEDLVFWVEHVIRTRGAPHLRSIVLRIPLYQRLYLDLAAIVLLGIIVVILIGSRILCLLTANKSKTKEKKN